MLLLENKNLAVNFSSTKGGPFIRRITNRLSNAAVEFHGHRFEISVNGHRLPPLTEQSISARVTEQTGDTLAFTFDVPGQSLTVRYAYHLLGSEITLRAEITNLGERPLTIDSCSFYDAHADKDVSRWGNEIDFTLGDAGSLDPEIQKKVEAFPLFIDDHMFCGIDWPVAENEVVKGGIRCRQFLGDLVAPGETVRTRDFTAGVSVRGGQPAAFLRHLARLRNRPTPRRSFYFDWLTHASEGVTEEQMALNLDLFEMLRREYGIHFDIYAVDDGVVETRWNRTYRLYRLKQQSLFPHGLKRQAERCAQLGMDFGIWIGPDGFGDSEQEALERTQTVVDMVRSWNVGLIKMDTCVAPALSDDPYHNERFMRRLEAMLQKCRQIRPDLIVINHRVTNSPYILAILDSTLWQGAECYPDVFLYNSDKPRLFTRFASYKRGSPSYFGVYSDLLEDHGICFNGFCEGWKQEFVLQAFGRALMLSPEVYGCLFMLPDSEYPAMAYLMRLAEEKKDLLQHTRYEPEYQAFIHTDGEKALVCLVNDSWEAAARVLDAAACLGRLDPGNGYTVRRLFPRDETGGGSISIAPGMRNVELRLAPFAVLLIEISPADKNLLGTEGGAVIPVISSSPGAMAGFSPIPLKPVNGGITETDIERAEKVRFGLSNDPAEIQQLRVCGESSIAEAERCRDAYRKKLRKESQGIAANAWDGDPQTCWSDEPFWKHVDNVWRLDLGGEYRIGRVEILLSDLRPGPVCGMDNGRTLGETVRIEVSTDARDWHVAEAVLFYKRLPKPPYTLAERFIAEFKEPGVSARYVRMYLKGVVVSDIRVREWEAGNLCEIGRTKWQGNNLMTARKPSAVYAARLRADVGEYIAATIGLEADGKLPLNQEVAVAWVEGEGLYRPILRGSPMPPAHHWECETLLIGNPAWTFWVPVDQEMAQRDLTLKAAWYGPALTNGCTLPVEPEINGHIVRL